MLRICSGYLGCGLHYGRNGSPQNPFSRKGLYPWAACSSVWLFLWNKTQHTNVCRLFKPSVWSSGSHRDHILWATTDILFLGFAWHLNLQPTTCFSCRCTNSHDSLNLSSRTVASSTKVICKTQNRIFCSPIAENQTAKKKNTLVYSQTAFHMSL